MKPLKIQFKQWIFSPGCISSLSTVLLLPLFVYLGFWQLERAEGKRELQQRFERQMAAPVLDFDKEVHDISNQIASIRYRRMHVSGKFLNEKQILLDNQIFEKRVGYRLITPFLPIFGNQLILVDRGFIPIEKNRSELPQLTPITEHIVLIGFIQQPSHGLQLKSDAFYATEKTERIWPIIVQRIDFKTLSTVLKQELYPFVLQLTEQSPYAFLMPPLSFGVSDTRHLGYAVQWFTIAVVTFLYYLVINSRRLKHATP